MEKIVNLVNKIYGRLQDQKSKDIFAYKLLHSLTGDDRYLQYIIGESLPAEELKKIIRSHSDKKVIIFGAGELGKYIFDCLEHLDWFHTACFWDNRKMEVSYKGIPIIQPDSYNEDIDKILVILATWNFRQEQYNQLRQMDVSDENIIDIIKIMGEGQSTKQYFDIPELSAIGENEVFIDGGCYDGVNTSQFMKWCEDKYRKIYAFEPDEENYSRCRDILSGKTDERFVLYNMGLSNREAEYRFHRAKDSSCFTDSGEEIVRVTAIDEIIKEPVTFLKLDIEGAELNAIQGAERTIRKDKPKCAISIYHKPEDIWEIPALLLEYNPDYRLFIRHYTLLQYETVLYAL